MLVNTSRGAVVDGGALKKVLNEGRLAGCVLDVWENEPAIDVELLERVDIGTPHIAGYSFDGKVKGLQQVYEQVCEHFGFSRDWDGETLPKQTSGGSGAAGPDAVVSLRETIGSAYDIMVDDKALRHITHSDPEARSRYFDSLRRDYRIRREFSAFQVRPQESDLVLAQTLDALGFRVEASLVNEA